MFKLTIVSGPMQGASYTLSQGQTIIGRNPDNTIVLSSARVSKKHCEISITNQEVNVRDLGSSNGTFVNGILIKTKRLLSGDRLSVGEFVLELTAREVTKQPVSTSKVIPMPGLSGIPMGSGGTIPGLGSAALQVPQATVASEQVPKDLQSKIKFYFEKYVINFVYNLNEKHEWRALMIGMFVILTIGAAIVSVYPVLSRVDEKLEQETRERAFLIARQMVDRNTVFIYEKLDTKVDVSFAEKEKGVLSAYIVDMEGRILAPARKLNQYISESAEAAFSADARAAFNKFEKLEEKSKAYESLMATAVPVRIFSAASGKNVTVALGLVFFDKSQVLFDSGTIALTYIQAFILSAIIAVVVFFSLYRLTLRPLLALNDDIDQVLKGNAVTVSRKYKMNEMDPLIDVINAALQRLPGTHTVGGLFGSESSSTDEWIQTVKFISEKMSHAGMLIFSSDKRILHMNAFMEEITGIRNEKAVGAEMLNVARDAAFNSFVEDVLGRAQSRHETISEDFEFSGKNYKMECVAVGQGNTPKLYILTATEVS